MTLAPRFIAVLIAITNHEPFQRFFVLLRRSKRLKPFCACVCPVTAMNRGVNKGIEPMHIETLKIFCDVVETGSFSKAAAKNLVTQSAVSQQLRMLEEKYDTQLLERGRQSARVTAAGEI